MNWLLIRRGVKERCDCRDRVGSPEWGDLLAVAAARVHDHSVTLCPGPQPAKEVHWESVSREAWSAVSGVSYSEVAHGQGLPVMRVLIYTFGTQGDVQPFVALARGLARVGHEAVVCTAEGFRELVEAHGVSFVHMGDEMLELVQEAMPAMRGRGDVGKLIRRMTAAMRSSLEEQWAAAQQVDPTVIVYHPKALGGFHIAERLAVVGVASLPLPFFTPTRAFPIPFIGHWPLGGRANELSYQFNRFTAVAYGGMINTFRRRTLGLGPLHRWEDYLHRSDGSPVPILYCFSRHVRPVPVDYPSHAYVTGYWSLDGEDSWKPSNELAEFLDRGDAPVYVGFGSMGFAKDGDRRREAIVTALARAGVRGVLATGWGGIPAAAADPNVITIDNVPHGWLFPRVAAVVHHGGARDDRCRSARRPPHPDLPLPGRSALLGPPDRAARGRP